VAVSTVLGRSTRATVEALIADERDPLVLANMALIRMRPKVPALTEALAGRVRRLPRALARAILAHIDFLDANIAALYQEVAARLGPFRDAVERLRTITGVGQTTAEVFVAETGADMSRFSSAGHLAAWAGLAPANDESAGKRRPAGTRNGAQWLRRALIESPKAASRTKGTYLAVRYRQVAGRRGRAGAGSQLLAHAPSSCPNGPGVPAQSSPPAVAPYRLELASRRTPSRTSGTCATASAVPQRLPPGGGDPEPWRFARRSAQCLPVSEATARNANPARNRAGLRIGGAVEFIEVVSPKGF
jgi:hypothetical protein